MKMMCAGCHRTPDQIDYAMWKDPEQTNDQYVLLEEGTLDPMTGLFLCDACYITYGMPSGPNGWQATKENLDRLGITVVL